MKTGFRSHALLISVLALYSIAGNSQAPNGQDLTLFQDSGGNGGRSPFNQGGPPGAVTAEDQSTPTMVLKGIYRFGNTYHITLQNTDGAVYKATWEQGQTASVPVGSYQLEGVDTRTVTLGLPAGVSCQQNAQSGSNCIGRSQVNLSFAESEPVSTRRNGGNGRSQTFTFSTNGNNRGGANRSDIQALFDAARNGDAAARDAAQAQLRNLIGNRGRGGNNNNGGGGRGRGGGNFNGGGGNGGGNGGGGNFIIATDGINGGNNGGNNNNGGRNGGGFQ